jgi:hypothetical protein
MVVHSRTIEARNNTHSELWPIFRLRIWVDLLPSIQRLHGLHRFHWLHGFHWFHRLHLSDFLIRFFKRQFFPILQLGLASHQFDLITTNPDKPNAIFALNPENEVLAGPKQLRGLRPFAGSKPGALILLLPRVTAAQCDLWVSSL